MTDDTQQLDSVLLKRWSDAIALREALGELESRLSERLKEAADALQPWIKQQGYSFVEVESRYARINIARSSWMNRKTKQPYVWFALDAIYPYGFRKVQEEHPYVWVFALNLEKNQRIAFQEHLLARLRHRTSEWVNDDCDRDYPAGRYITTHPDLERLELAQTSEGLASFAREALGSIFVLGDDVDAALQKTLET